MALSMLFIFFLSGFSAPAFAHDASIEAGGGNRYKALRLTPQVYNAANSDLSDLLIKDSSGEDVPYFINAGFQEIFADREAYPMELIDSYVEDDSFCFDYRLATERDSDTIATSVEFAATGADFAKVVDIYGSYDNIHWEFVQNDKIYAIDGVQKLSVEFTQPEKYTHYRFKLSNNLERISFDAVNLIYNVETWGEVYFVESLVPEFRVENFGDRTDIIIDGLKNLRLRDITISSGSMFKRTATAPGGIQKEIYDLSLNGASYSDTSIPLDRYISQDESYVVTISDYDDKPIEISGITIGYYADDLVFEGIAGESYTLEFGADPAKTPPVYDIERYKKEILEGPIDRAALGEIHYAAPEEAPPEQDYRMLFNIVVIGVAALLGAVILMKLRK
jgi:hypothetical protein